jgi:hypothetical protein
MYQVIRLFDHSVVLSVGCLFRCSFNLFESVLFCRRVSRDVSRGVVVGRIEEESDEKIGEST